MNLLMGQNLAFTGGRRVFPPPDRTYSMPINKTHGHRPVCITCSYKIAQRQQKLELDVRGVCKVWFSNEAHISPYRAQSVCSKEIMQEKGIQWSLLTALGIRSFQNEQTGQ